MSLLAIINLPRSVYSYFATPYFSHQTTRNSLKTFQTTKVGSKSNRLPFNIHLITPRLDSGLRKKKYVSSLRERLKMNPSDLTLVACTCHVIRCMVDRDYVGLYGGRLLNFCPIFMFASSDETLVCNGPVYKVDPYSILLSSTYHLPTCQPPICLLAYLLPWGAIFRSAQL